MKGANDRLGNYVQKDSPVNILKLNNNFLKFDDNFDNQIKHICKAYNFFEFVHLAQDKKIYKY